MAVKKKPKKAVFQILIALVITVVLGAGAIFLLFTVFGQVSSQSQAVVAEQQKKQEELQKELEAAKLAAQQAQKQDYFEVQATLDIEPGEIITQHMVERVEIDQRAGANILTRPSDAIGKVASSKILQGQPIDKKTVISGDGLIQVKSGQRAITIKVDNHGSLNGNIMPGTMVDILTTIEEKANGGNTNVITKTLLQNIQVIAVGDSSSSISTRNTGGKSDGSVTLSVTPKQAEMLVLANEVGKFHLTKRSFSDSNKVESFGSDINTLLTGLDMRKPAEPKKQAPPPLSEIDINSFNDLPEPAQPLDTSPKYQMEVYQGGTSTTVQFGL